MEHSWWWKWDVRRYDYEADNKEVMMLSNTDDDNADYFGETVDVDNFWFIDHC